MNTNEYETWNTVGRKRKNIKQISNNFEVNILSKSSIINKKNGPKKKEKKIEVDCISLWMKTVVVGDVNIKVKNYLSEMHYLPSGRVESFWDCLHNGIKKIMKDDNLSNKETLNGIIKQYRQLEIKEDSSIISLTKKYKFHLQITSLNKDFKSLNYGNEFRMKMQLLHIGYQYFMPIMINNYNKNYQLCQKDKKILDGLNTIVTEPSNSNIVQDRQLLHSLRTIMEGNECAQDFPDLPIKGSKKKPYYDILPIKDLQENKNLKLCTLHIENAHFAKAIINQEGGKENFISLLGRKNCGYNAFEGDTVYVKINDPIAVTGKVLGVEHSDHKPVNSIYMCKVCRDQGSLMTPLDGTFPKIHVDNEPGRRKYEKQLKNGSILHNIKDEQKTEDMKKREHSSFGDNKFVTVYKLKFDKKLNKRIFFDAKIETFDPETCDKLFLVCYEYWDIARMYPLGKVVGIISTYDSFEDTLHLILPLSKIETPTINKTYKNEIKSIKIKVKETKCTPNDIVPKGAMVFTIDNEETQDMDDALSYHVKNDSIIVGVHITDITKYISPQDNIYKEAQKRFSTTYIAKELRKEPIYLIEKELSTKVFSLVPNELRAVVSVMFHFTKNVPHILVNVTFGETFIKSKYKLNYKQVESWIKEEEKPADVEEDLFISIKRCYEIAKETRRTRLPDSYFVRQSNYNKPGFQFDDNFNAQFLIEEFMIMANEHVAKKIYEAYPNMTLIRVQDKVIDYEGWQKKFFETSNFNLKSSLTHSCNLLNIQRNGDNHKDLVMSLQYYENFMKYQSENLTRAKNMLQYDEYISDFYFHLSEWYEICSPARYECSIQDCIDNRHFSLNKNIYTHFTSPIRRFSDVIVHRLLKSILNPEKGIDSLDDTEIDKVCKIGNQRVKGNKLFEKRCATYVIFEGSSSVYSFVLDCTCSNITNEALHFVHPILKRLSAVKFIKFCYLSLDTSPVQLKPNEAATSCELKWKKIIHSNESNERGVSKSSFIIDNNIYEVRLSESVHLIFQEIRSSDLSQEELRTKLEQLVSKFVTKKVDKVITSNCSVDPIIEIKLNISIKNTMRIQFCSYKVNGLKRVNPELLIVHPSFQLCLIHKEDPVMCFAPGGQLKLENNDIVWSFKSVKKYKKYFTPLIQLESLKETLQDKSEFTLLDISISWINAMSSITNKNEIFGIIKFSSEIYELKNIEFGDESDSIEESYAKIINTSMLSVTGDLVCLRGKRKDWENYWVGHGTLVHICKYQEKKDELLFKVIVFMVTQSDFDIFDDKFSDMKFAFEIYSRSISSRRQLEAVSCIHEHLFLIDITMGKDIHPLESDENIPEDVKKYLSINSKQEVAIKNAMNEKFSLIWGPPGTGKTSIGCILAFCFYVKNNGVGNVLYCGPSNDCVNLVIDAMLEKFNKNCPPMLRIFSKKQELADFPLPGHVTKCIPLSNTMQKTSLHHLIRKPDTEYGEKLKIFDQQFEKHRNNPNSWNEKESIYRTIRKYKNILQKAKEEYVQNNYFDMILCTTSVAISHIMRFFSIIQIIIDEAGMCKEPETLLPILGAIKTVRNVVLIGDHKQLRPVILDDLASNHGLEISLFERYQLLKPNKVTMLDQQYRMHPSICDFPSEFFYNKKLYTVPSPKWTGLQDSDFVSKDSYSQWNGVDYSGAKFNYKEKLKSSSYSAIPDEKWPGKRETPYDSFKIPFKRYAERVVFIDVVGDDYAQAVSTSTCGENSRANKEEIEAVGYIYGKLIARIGSKEEAVKHITVLTQYRLQEDLLFQKCKEILHMPKIDPIVKTVIKSQGSENDYVIFSTVRSLRSDVDIIETSSPGWENKYLGFITDHNQINVALTRARKGLIIIGNRSLLSVNSMWKLLLDNLKKRGCVLDDPKKFL